MKLEGSDAMHAWVSPGAARVGWTGLDPDQRHLAGNDHVVLAIGRDYADVAPIDGVIFIDGASPEVSLQVLPVPSGSSAPEIAAGFAACHKLSDNAD